MRYTLFFWYNNPKNGPSRLQKSFINFSAFDSKVINGLKPQKHWETAWKLIKKDSFFKHCQCLIIKQQLAQNQSKTSTFYQIVSNNDNNNLDINFIARFEAGSEAGSKANLKLAFLKEEFNSKLGNNNDLETFLATEAGESLK